VMIPINFRVCSFSITGIGPMFSRFIISATFVTKSVGRQQTGSLVMTSSQVFINFSYFETIFDHRNRHYDRYCCRIKVYRAGYLIVLKESLYDLAYPVLNRAADRIVVWQNEADMSLLTVLFVKARGVKLHQAVLILQG
jgi:hypothetical protein